jgi:cytochrome bd ubiquinol oxidase subunit I
LSHDTLLDLSRWQWPLTAAFHITFPAVTVGTSAFPMVCYAMYMRTDDDVWLRMFRFWRRIFAVGFTLGVVSGIVLTFEFGLNWGPLAHVGPIVGVAILMEVIMAFFSRPASSGCSFTVKGGLARATWNVPSTRLATWGAGELSVRVVEVDAVDLQALQRGAGLALDRLRTLSPETAHRGSSLR